MVEGDRRNIWIGAWGKGVGFKLSTGTSLHATAENLGTRLAYIGV